ncbi:hypothetical protein LG3211_3728 [Lysobacter gummosus]|nr:hypothetical protein LG3211_3728 [Lysobacter gummosus]
MNHRCDALPHVRCDGGSGHAQNRSPEEYELISQPTEISRI